MGARGTLKHCLGGHGSVTVRLSFGLATVAVLGAVTPPAAHAATASLLKDINPGAATGSAVAPSSNPRRPQGRSSSAPRTATAGMGVSSGSRTGLGRGQCSSPTPHPVSRTWTALTPMTLLLSAPRSSLKAQIRPTASSFGSRMGRRAVRPWSRTSPRTTRSPGSKALIPAISPAWAASSSSLPMTPSTERSSGGLTERRQGLGPSRTLIPGRGGWWATAASSSSEGSIPPTDRSFGARTAPPPGPRW